MTYIYIHMDIYNRHLHPKKKSRCTASDNTNKYYIYRLIYIYKL